MDILSLVGLLLALVALVGGSILKGAGLSSLWSSAAFVIVIVGTVAAIFVHTPPTVFKRALRIVGWILKPPAADREALMAQILEWSNIARRQGLLGLEQQVAEQDDAFLKKGLQMLVDGVEPEQIRHMLEIDLDSQEHQDLAAAKVFEGMGIYAPTLGIIGAVHQQLQAFLEEGVGLLRHHRLESEQALLAGGVAPFDHLLDQRVAIARRRLHHPAEQPEREDDA